MSTCDEIRAELSAYADGELTPVERAACDEHLHGGPKRRDYEASEAAHAASDEHMRGCAACRAVLAELQAVSSSVAALPRLQAPPALAAGVKRELLGAEQHGNELETQRATLRQRANFFANRSVWTRVGAGVAAIIMVAVLGFILVPAISRHSFERTARHSAEDARRPAMKAVSTTPAAGRDEAKKSAQAVASKTLPAEKAAEVGQVELPLQPGARKPEPIAATNPEPINELAKDKLVDGQPAFHAAAPEKRFAAKGAAPAALPAPTVQLPAPSAPAPGVFGGGRGGSEGGAAAGARARNAKAPGSVGEMHPDIPQPKVEADKAEFAAKEKELDAGNKKSDALRGAVARRRDSGSVGEQNIFDEKAAKDVAMTKQKAVSPSQSEEKGKVAAAEGQYKRSEQPMPRKGPGQEFAFEERTGGAQASKSGTEFKKEAYKIAQTPAAAQGQTGALAGGQARQFQQDLSAVPIFYRTAEPERLVAQLKQLATANGAQWLPAERTLPFSQNMLNNTPNAEKQQVWNSPRNAADTLSFEIVTTSGLREALVARLRELLAAERLASQVAEAPQPDGGMLSNAQERDEPQAQNRQIAQTAPGATQELTPKKPAESTVPLAAKPAEIAQPQQGTGAAREARIQIRIQVLQPPAAAARVTPQVEASKSRPAAADMEAKPADPVKQ